jgi:hypothetical protein
VTSTAVPRAGASSFGGVPEGEPRGWLLDAVLVLGVTAAAVWLRVEPLGPSSLWLDDAWVAIVYRTEGLTELRYVGFAAPGFVVVLRAWLGLVGFSETAAQTLPFVAGVAAPGLAYLVGRRFGWHRAAALVAAAVLVFSPMAMDYATRVKPYTIESVLALALLWAALHLLDDVRSTRRWTTFAGVGALATMVSAFLAPYVAAGVAAGIVRGLLDRDREAVSRGSAATLAYGAFAGAWYLGVLAPAVTTSVSAFWSGNYVVLTEGVATAIAGARAAASGVAEGLVGLPVAVTLLVLLLATVIVGLRRLEHAVLLVTPTLVAAVLAAAQLAPLGGGRTDIYLYPGLALLVAGGAEPIVRTLARRRGWVAWGVPVVVAATLAVVTDPVTPYPRQDVRPLIVELEERREPRDAVLIYPATMWAYALYTSDGFALEEDVVSAWGFAPVFDDERTYVLPPGRDDPGAYAPTVEQLQEGERRVWLLASHWREDYDDLQEQLREAGFVLVGVSADDGAELGLWERSRTVAG